MQPKDDVQTRYQQSVIAIACRYNVNVKFTPEQNIKAQRGRRSRALLFL
jgi:hypothetical protein